MTRDGVYTLCNKKKWFTGGSALSYERMFQLVEGEYGVEKVAIAIWVCSPGVELGDIIQELYKCN